MTDVNQTIVFGICKDTLAVSHGIPSLIYIQCRLLDEQTTLDMTSLGAIAPLGSLLERSFFRTILYDSEMSVRTDT